MIVMISFELDHLAAIEHAWRERGSRMEYQGMGSDIRVTLQCITIPASYQAIHAAIHRSVEWLSRQKEHRTSCYPVRFTQMANEHGIPNWQK